MSNTQSGSIEVDLNISNVFLEEALPSLTADSIAMAGTAHRGPAFVPNTFQQFDESQETLNTFQNTYGKVGMSNEANMSMFAAKEWFLQGGEQLTYVRTLGVGKTGLPDSNGLTQGSGFIVGGQTVSGSINEGFKGDNSFATPADEGNYLADGKTHFIGAVFENIPKVAGIINPNYDYLEQIGLSGDASKPLITEVVFAAQGVDIKLEKSESQIGDGFESLDLSDRSDANDFVNETTLESPKIVLLGHNDADQSILNDYDSSNKFSSVSRRFNEDFINRDSRYYLHKGHLSYSSFYPNSDRDPLKIVGDESANKIFITEQDSTEAEVIDYQDFTSPFKTAKSPWVYSQALGVGDNDSERSDWKKKCIKLFRFHAIDDGEVGNRFRISVKPKRIGDKSLLDWSRFDVIVHEYVDSENSFSKILHYSDVNLNPSSESYIGYLFGTENRFYDFKTKKIVIEGEYKQTNNFLRVEINKDIELKNIDAYELIPSGFEQYPKINTENLNSITDNQASPMQMPVRYVPNLLAEAGDIGKLSSNTYWGVLFDEVNYTKYKNILLGSGDNQKTVDLEFAQLLSNDNDSSASKRRKYLGYTKYFQNNIGAKNVWIEDNEPNSFFHLEKILYNENAVGANNDTLSLMQESFYRRDGKRTGDINFNDDSSNSFTIGSVDYKYFNITNIFSDDRDSNDGDSKYSEYLCFDFFTYGGFDGLNILDRDKHLMNQTALVKELEDENSDADIEGPTYFAYKTAHDMLVSEENCESDIIVMPTIGHHYLNKQMSVTAGEKRKYVLLLNSPEYSSHTRSSEADDDPLTLNGIIKDNNYFRIKPGAAPDDGNNYLITKKDLSTYLDTGTSLSLDSVRNIFYNNRHTMSLLNSIKGNINDLTGSYSFDDNRVVVNPSFLAIKALAKGVSRLPIDSFVDFNESEIVISEVFNPNFSDAGNNEFRNFINTSKRSGYSVNLVVNENAVKLNSANMAVTNRNSLSRYCHNIRILNSVKKEIKYFLYTADLLFNNNSRLNAVVSNLEGGLRQILQNYLSSGTIKDYYVKVNTGESAREQSDILNNILRSKVAISLFGAADDVIQTLTLDDILNTTQNILTEFTNTSIIEPSR